MVQDQGFAATGVKTAMKTPIKEPSRDAQCNGVSAEYGNPVAGLAGTVWPLAKRIQSILCMEKSRRMGERADEFDPARYSR